MHLFRFHFNVLKVPLKLEGWAISVTSLGLMMHDSDFLYSRLKSLLVIKNTMFMLSSCIMLKQHWSFRPQNGNKVSEGITTPVLKRLGC